MSSPIDLAWLATKFPNIANLQEIGRGGQKIVLSGVHAVDGSVVLKLYSPNSEIDRISREVQSASQIRSPRIPRIQEQGIIGSPIGDVVWIREERIPGRNLRQALAGGPMGNSDVLKVALETLEALAAAEEMRIVHRDVKPENIIVDNNSSTWLIDFGISRHLDLSSLTLSGMAHALGTAGYAPPEQFQNRKAEIDSRADLFGLGVTLYECVEGSNPFRAGARDPIEMLRRVETTSLPRIGRQCDKLNQFGDLVVAMTRTRRDHRLPTAASALEWMQEIMAGEDAK